jgi:hypothetical protein
MKKLLVTVISLAFSILTIQPVYAADSTAKFPQLKMEITNTIKGQRFALCLSETCYNLAADNKTISMDESQIYSVIMANMGTMKMYTQALPASCKVQVQDNQILTVKGKLVAKKNEVLLNNLSCTVTPHA